MTADAAGRTPSPDGEGAAMARLKARDYAGKYRGAGEAIHLEAWRLID